MGVEVEPEAKRVDDKFLSWSMCNCRPDRFTTSVLRTILVRLPNGLGGRGEN